MAVEGDNPTPQVQRLHDAVPRCTYNVDFYAALRLPYRTDDLLYQPLRTDQKHHHRRPPPLLSPTRLWLCNRDLRWQQQQVQQLLLQEKEQLLDGSQLMGPDSLLAAYSYEHGSNDSTSPPEKAAATREEAVAGPAIGETVAAAEGDLGGSLGTPPDSPGDWSAASTRCCTATPNCDSSGSEGVSRPTQALRKGSIISSSSIGANECRGSAMQLIDQRRARMFARSELLTAQVRTEPLPTNPDEQEAAGSASLTAAEAAPESTGSAYTTMPNTVLPFYLCLLFAGDICSSQVYYRPRASVHPGTAHGGGARVR